MNNESMARGLIANLRREMSEMLKRDGRRHEDAYPGFDAARSIHTLFGLAESEVPHLRAEIKAAGGTVIALVHPYFEKYYHGTPADYTDDLKRLEEVVRRIEGMVSRSAGKKVPIIVLEDYNKTAETRVHLESLSDSKRVHVIATHFSNPLPKFTVDTNEGAKEGEWPEVRAVFKEIGVQNILLGGMYYLDTGGETTCVDVTKSALEPYFNLKLSKSLTFTQPAYNRNNR
jgi:hypothetical protein